MPGLYDIDPMTGVATLITATPSGTDFGGLDSDGARLYGLNDGTGLQGRGLYAIDPNANTYSLLTGYPAGDIDIDGLAIGNGRAYFVNDVGSQQIFVYNLNTNAFETPLANPFGTGGIFSAGAFIPTPGAVSLLAISGLVGMRDAAETPGDLATMTGFFTGRDERSSRPTSFSGVPLRRAVSPAATPPGLTGLPGCAGGCCFSGAGVRDGVRAVHCVSTRGG